MAFSPSIKQPQPCLVRAYRSDYSLAAGVQHSFHFITQIANLTTWPVPQPFKDSLCCDTLLLWSIKDFSWNPRLLCFCYTVGARGVGALDRTSRSLGGIVSQVHLGGIAPPVPVTDRVATSAPLTVIPAAPVRNLEPFRLSVTSCEVC